MGNSSQNPENKHLKDAVMWEDQEAPQAFEIWVYFGQT
jgi:hypothetical protein